MPILSENRRLRIGSILLSCRANPYPTYERLREETPVAWIPGLNKFLVTSFDGCRAVEADQSTYSANVSSGAMAKALGARPMLRKDDPEHAADRRAVNSTLRPKNLNEAWAPDFERNARYYVDVLKDRGPQSADLNTDFAAPLAAQNLIDLLGLKDVDVCDMQRWSLDFIDGIANVLDEPEVWARCDKSQGEVDSILTQLIPYYRRQPNPSLTSALANSGMSDFDVATNVKLTISGGMNEPQHMITNSIWALDQHPDQLQQVLIDGSLWDAVFDETLRWLSPIGMAPRQTTRATVLEGYSLPAHASIGIGLASANRDGKHFSQDPDRFDISRPKQPHMAFGSGVHLCAGQWAARISIGRIAVPLLYEEIPGLRVDNDRSAVWHGWVFRGLTQLPITWS
jgi:cytochrome P450